MSETRHRKYHFDFKKNRKENEPEDIIIRPYDPQTNVEDIIIDCCQFCGGNEFIECRLKGTYYDKDFISLEGGRGTEYDYVDGCHYTVCFSDALYALVCRNCGSVARMYCNDPEKLYPDDYDD